ncbi:hypothetical protein E2C01_007433 [Portunus trituberculatus]|uniref:Uncharacterized protein n=1 Tax=Portunus trituberculatus TaxID=210409 RepID=A0A5B7CY72_PORTR|nr:hypothetical protein [Portunus trituberculatus]
MDAVVGRLCEGRLLMTVKLNEWSRRIRESYEAPKLSRARLAVAVAGVWEHFVLVHRTVREIDGEVDIGRNYYYFFVSLLLGRSVPVSGVRMCGLYLVLHTPVLS